MNQKKVMQAIESICSTGCESVKAIIKTLEAGKTVAGTEDFTEAEINELTIELKSIMTVYDFKN